MREDLKYAFGQEIRREKNLAVFEIRRETDLAVFVSLANFKPLIPG